MHRRTVLAAGALALAGCSASTSEIDTAAAETAVREGIGDERASAGVTTLTHDERLQTAARAHSRDMGQRDFYGHTNPDGEGPSDRVRCRAGENVHRGEIGQMKNVDSSKEWYTTDAEGIAGYVVEGWVLSKGHYRLMTDSRWRRIGVGVHVTDDGEFFATAMFC